MSKFSRPSARTLTRTLAVAATAVGLGFVAPAGSVVSTTAAADAASDCLTAPSNARTTHRSGVDPNSVTAAQAATMDRALDAKVRKLAASGVLARNGTARGGSHKIIKIKTYFHVITKKNGTGRVTRNQVRRQVAVMNKAFAGRTSADAANTPFRFVLKGTDYTRNNDWYDWDFPERGADNDDRKAKRALHRGGWKALNVYTTNFTDVGLLGYASFPDEGKLKLDGVVVLNESLPGGSAAPFNRGDTLTHEVGHWLGLFHTFQGGCKAPGDHVKDTPFQADGPNVASCDESLDTCKQPGMDPVHNFMSYGDDPCLDNFTHGQERRMTKAWFAFRA